MRPNKQYPNKVTPLPGPPLPCKDCGGIRFHYLSCEIGTMTEPPSPPLSMDEYIRGKVH